MQACKRSRDELQPHVTCAWPQPAQQQRATQVGAHYGRAGLARASHPSISSTTIVTVTRRPQRRVALLCTGRAGAAAAAAAAAICPRSAIPCLHVQKAVHTARHRYPHLAVGLPAYSGAVHRPGANERGPCERGPCTADKSWRSSRRLGAGTCIIIATCCVHSQVLCCISTIAAGVREGGHQEPPGAQQHRPAHPPAPA